MRVGYGVNYILQNDHTAESTSLKPFQHKLNIRAFMKGLTTVWLDCAGFRYLIKCAERKDTVYIWDYEELQLKLYFL